MIFTCHSTCYFFYSSFSPSPDLDTYEKRKIYSKNEVGTTGPLSPKKQIHIYTKGTDVYHNNYFLFCILSGVMLAKEAELMKATGGPEH